MSDHAEIDRIHGLGMLIWMVVGTVNLRLLNSRRSETWDMFLERMIALSKLTNHHAIIHGHAVVTLELVYDLFLKVADIF